MLDISGLTAEHQGVAVVRDFDLTLGAGEIVAVLGPSGGGKTTLLRAIAGLHRPAAGRIVLRDHDITRLAPEHRRIGFVPQEGALFEHLSVAANVGYGLRRRGSSRLERNSRIDTMLRLVALEGLASRFPHELSGGQQQRVAVARALSVSPHLVLLDEPFSALDAGLRLELRQEISALLRSQRVGALLVTHDQEEALSLSDRVVLMNEGRLVQQGRPADVYEHPATSWAATFLGDATLLPAVAGGAYADSALGRVPLQRMTHGACLLLFRPSQIEAVRSHPGEVRGARGTVAMTRYQGDALLTEVRLESGPTVLCRTAPGSPDAQPGASLELTVSDPVWPMAPEAGP